MVYSNHQLITHYLDNPTEENFEKIVKEFSPMVYSVCYRVLNRGDLAEEASQATFLSLIEKKDKLTGGPSMIGWLHRVAYLSSLWLRKQENIRKKREKEIQAQPSKYFTDNQLEDSELNAFVDEAIQSLPGKYKDPLLMKFYENKTYKEIGLSFKTTEESIRKRVHRGLDKIKIFLRKRNVVATSTVIGTFLGSQLISTNACASSLPINYVAPVITGNGLSAINSIKIYKGVEQMILLTKLKATAIVLSASIIIGASGMSTIIGDEGNGMTITKNKGSAKVTIKKGPNNVQVKSIDKKTSNNIGTPENLVTVELANHNEGKTHSITSSGIQQQGEGDYLKKYHQMKKKLDDDKVKFYQFWAEKAIADSDANQSKQKDLANAIENYYDDVTKTAADLKVKMFEKKKAFYANNGRVNYKDKAAYKAYRKKSAALYKGFSKDFTNAKNKKIKALNNKIATLFADKSKPIQNWIKSNNILNLRWSSKQTKKEGKTFYSLDYNYNSYHSTKVNMSGAKNVSIKTIE